MRSMFAARVVVLVALAGCGNTPTMTSDCATDPSKCGCATDATCAAPTPRCDTRTGQCVPCLPTTDNCPAGQHCVSTGTTYGCMPKAACTVIADCPMSGGKPGLCCGGTCADPMNDTNHCGACGNVCGNVANGTGGCVNGTCGVTMCNAGFGDCDKKGANGCESDTTANVLHCGDCDTACNPTPNTKVACVAGKCKYDCVADFADCDKNPANGCETSTTTNPKNCGACNKSCPNLPNATDVACVSSTCVVSMCAPDFIDCNKLPADGCESNIKSDPNNCSGCGRKCPAVTNGTPGCISSSCGIGKCNPGFADCDGDVLNGCEQDLSADSKNCGGCGVSCNIANGVASCQAGKCVLQACTQGFADCDLDPLNGCEVNTNTSLGNCGQCGNACPVPKNATASCSFGVCGIGSCMYGFADCNKNINDGCETNILQVNNCGACGVMCMNPANSVAACPSAACVIGSCNVGFADCDMKYFTGCEINIQTDLNNCGACGNVCPPVKNVAGACLAGKCGVGNCLMGFGDCNKNMADGCEVDLTSDAKNCGACGNACPMNTPNCSSGQCVNAWLPVGAQTNIPANMLAGWKECYRGQYGQSGISLANIQAQCPGSKLMVACGKSADPNTLILLAWAPRADVLFQTGGQNNPAEVHTANGVGWYYNSNWSWGFVQNGDTPNNNSCDVANNNPQFRLCWHAGSGNLSGGYRCGSTTGLNGDNSWDRIIYQIP